MTDEAPTHAATAGGQASDALKESVPSIVKNGSKLQQDAWRSLRNLSSIAGLRASTDFPLDTLIAESDENASEPPKPAA